MQKIREELDQECPCCRDAGSQDDRLWLAEEGDEEDDEEEHDDDDSEVSEESEEAEEFDEEEWTTRIIIVRRRREDPEEKAARDIQRIYRGYKGRELLQNAMALTTLKH